jgi:hypothetical protein
LRNSARDFLAVVKLTRDQQTSHDLLAEILQSALTGPEHESVVYAFCRRILAAVGEHEVYCWDVADSLTALAKKFPNAFLNVILDETEHPGLFFHDLDYTGWSVLDAIPDDTLITWASENPKKRLKTLAEMVVFMSGGQGGRPVVWSTKAERVIACADNPISVLKLFFERLDPSSWSGSRAEVMRSRLPLLDSLQSHSNAAISAWAVEARRRFLADIERESAHEAAQSKERDERFE